MRIHLLALPNAQTTKAYSLDGFAMATIRFARILRILGYETILYASEENEAPCDELVTVIAKEEIETLLRHDRNTEYQHAWIDGRSPLFQLANERTKWEIGKRKRRRDVICLIGGESQKYVTEAHPDLLAVEYSIGYTGSFAPYRVFESTAWRHETYGRQGIADGRFFDAVIPCFFDAGDFPMNDAPEPFALYVGRTIRRKGIEIACTAARKAGLPLKIIGHGGDASDRALLTYGEHLGALPYAERNLWMARAAAVIAPTLYVEPFNCVAVEAQLCGTPVVATDWGGFTETIEQGRTGFRCTYLGEFVEGLKRCITLDREYVAHRARQLYSLEAVAPLYGRYFDRLAMLWKDGWNTLTAPEALVRG